jgi:hypothetical protein
MRGLNVMMVMLGHKKAVHNKRQYTNVSQIWQAHWEIVFVRHLFFALSP